MCNSEQSLDVCHNSHDSVNCPKCLYKQMVEKVNRLKLPRGQWMFIIEESSIRFYRIERELNCYLTVSLDSELNIKIYHHNRLLNWMEWEKPKSEEDVENMLEIVNDCIDSSFMFVS